MSLISIHLLLLRSLLQVLFLIPVLVLLYVLHFSVFLLLLLLSYVKLDKSFCYQVLVEVSKFLIIFIFTIWQWLCL